MKDNLKKFLTNKDEIIKTACFAFIIGFLLMGASTTISGNIGAKAVNVISSICYGLTFIGIFFLIFYKEIFDKAKINKKIITKIIVAFLCLLVSIILILISSDEVFNIKGLDEILFWLVVVSMFSVSILVIATQYLIDKVYWEEKPIMAYVILILCMLYALAFAVRIKPDLVFKIFFTIHTIASLIVFVNTVFRYGIKAKNIWQITFFVLSVICLMALMIYTLYMWFWSTNTELFTSIMGVFAGLLGGIITLGGVAWTIKRQDDARKAMEIEKAKPYLKLEYNSEIERSALELKRYFNFIIKIKDKFSIKMNAFIVKVTNQADCFLCGLMIDENYFDFTYTEFAERQDSFKIKNFDCYVQDDKQLPNIHIVTRDKLGNYYTNKLNIEKIKIRMGDKEKYNYHVNYIELPILIEKEEIDKKRY